MSQASPRDGSGAQAPSRKPEFQAVGSAAEREALLKDLQTNRTALKITLEDGRVFQSFLLAVNRGKGYLILDQLTPPPEEGRLSRGSALRCLAHTRGIAIRFSSSVRARGERDGEVLYKLDFPSRLERRQRREFYRVPVPLDLGYQARLSDPGRFDLQGEIADLCANGVGIRIKGDPPEGLEAGVIIPQATLELEGRPITCRLELCNLRRLKERRWLLGCRFDQIAPGHQNAVNKVVTALDREMRKKEKC